MQQAAYSLPSQRFSLALSFPQPTPLLGRTDVLNRSHDFMKKISFLCVLCSIVGMCSLACHLEGDGEGGKRGTGFSPQDSGRWVTHDPSTQSIKDTSGKDGHRRRASDNLFERGESASNDAYSLPSQRFSLALSFPQPSPLLGKTDVLNRSHDFSRQSSPLCVLCSIVGMCSLACHLEGDGEGGKRGTGGENPEGEGGLQPGCPPFPWVVSPRFW